MMATTNHAGHEEKIAPCADCTHAFVHDDEGCTYGRGTAFGGCKCPAHRVRGRRRAQKFVRVDRGVALDRELVAAALRDLRSAIGKALDAFEVLVLMSPATPWTSTRSSSTSFDTLDDVRRVLDHEPAPIKLPPPKIRPRMVAGKGEVTGEVIPKGEQRVLTAIAQHPSGVTRKQVTVLTGYKRRTRDDYIARLARRELVEVAGDRILATPMARGALGPHFKPLPTGPELLAHWRRELPAGERRVLDAVVEFYPHAAPRDHIDERTAFKVRTRNDYIARLARRELVRVTGRGVVASEELFSR